MNEKNRDNVKRLKEVTRKLNDQSLSISRVPSDTKKDFIGLANAQFCGDYGLLLQHILSQSNEYNYMKALFFDKMQNMEDKIDKLIDNFNSLNKQEEKQTSTKRLGR